MRYLVILALPLIMIQVGTTKECSLDKYVRSFEFEAARKDKHVKVEAITIEIVDRLTDLDLSAVGICYRDAPKLIQIKRSYWVRTTEALREELIFHELGHCILGKDHTEHNGIMRSALMPNDDYLANRESYLKELFE